MSQEPILAASPVTCQEHIVYVPTAVCQRRGGELIYIYISIYISMYVCMYVCIHTYMYMCTLAQAERSEYYGFVGDENPNKAPEPYTPPPPRKNPKPLDQTTQICLVSSWPLALNCATRCYKGFPAFANGRGQG